MSMPVLHSLGAVGNPSPLLPALLKYSLKSVWISGEWSPTLWVWIWIFVDDLISMRERGKEIV
ncbi:hypothetical protein QCA50_014285 [Cerrena zonata]|uniref:Uncharacterized protein n=1 Tax=Cerrena zonata TaxID=2478898 RepID=A0AAW0FMC2_9APHY